LGLLRMRFRLRKPDAATAAFLSSWPPAARICGGHTTCFVCDPQAVSATIPDLASRVRGACCRPCAITRFDFLRRILAYLPLLPSNAPMSVPSAAGSVDDLPVTGAGGRAVSVAEPLKLFVLVSMSGSPACRRVGKGRATAVLAATDQESVPDLVGPCWARRLSPASLLRL